MTFVFENGVRINKLLSKEALAAEVAKAESNAPKGA